MSIKRWITNWQSGPCCPCTCVNVGSWIPLVFTLSPRLEPLQPRLSWTSWISKHGNNHCLPGSAEYFCPTCWAKFKLPCAVMWLRFRPMLWRAKNGMKQAWLIYILITSNIQNDRTGVRELRCHASQLNPYQKSHMAWVKLDVSASSSALTNDRYGGDYVSPQGDVVHGETSFITRRTIEVLREI